MKNRIILSCLALIFSNILLLSQTRVEISETEKKFLSDRVLQKVEEFTKSLSNMVNDSLSKEVRTHHQYNILGLTMAKGEPYDIVIDSTQHHSTGVKMVTSSVNRSVTKSQLLKVYLKKLYNPITGKPEMKYKSITIETADHIQVENIEKEGDHYVCNAIFYQYFRGRNGDGSSYIDYTAKRIKCYIIPTELPDGKGFDVKLADISVIETRRI